MYVKFAFVNYYSYLCFVKFSAMINVVKEIIEKEKLSNKEFAEKVGVGAPAVSNYVNGRYPNSETINKIMRAFPRINPEWLLNGTEPMYKPSGYSQGDLFAIPDADQSAKNEISAGNPMAGQVSETRNQTPVNNIETVSQQIDTNRVVEQIIQKVPARIITRIVVYYSDNTYEDFLAR